MISSSPNNKSIPLYESLVVSHTIESILPDVSPAPNCDISSLGPFVSVVTDSLCGSHRFMLFRSVLFHTALQQVLIWNISEEVYHEHCIQPQPQNFRIVATNLCYLGNIDFVNCFVLFLISNTYQLYMYHHILRATDLWSYESPETKVVSKDSFVCLSLPTDNGGDEVTYNASNEIEMQPKLITTPLPKQKESANDLSRHILLCFTMASGHLRICIISLDIQLCNETDTIRHELLTLSSVSLFDQLGTIKKLKWEPSGVVSAPRTTEWALMISGSRRCGILTIHVSPSLTLKAQLRPIGTQEVPPHCVTDVEAMLRETEESVDETQTLPYFVCTRSKNRLWISNVQGYVESTLKIYNPYSRSLGYIGQLSQNYLLSWNEHNEPLTVSSGSESFPFNFYVVSLTALSVIQKITIQPLFHNMVFHDIQATFWDREAGRFLFAVTTSLQSSVTLTPTKSLALYHITILPPDSPFTVTHLALKNLKSKRQVDEQKVMPPKENFSASDLPIVRDLLLRETKPRLPFQNMPCEMLLPLSLTSDTSSTHLRRVAHVCTPPLPAVRCTWIQDSNTFTLGCSDTRATSVDVSYLRDPSLVAKHPFFYRLPTSGNIFLDSTQNQSSALSLAARNTLTRHTFPDHNDARALSAYMHDDISAVFTSFFLNKQKYYNPSINSFSLYLLTDTFVYSPFTEDVQIAHQTLHNNSSLNKDSGAFLTDSHIYSSWTQYSLPSHHIGFIVKNLSFDPPLEGDPHFVCGQQHCGSSIQRCTLHVSLFNNGEPQNDSSYAIINNVDKPKEDEKPNSIDSLHTTLNKKHSTWYASDSLREREFLYDKLHCSRGTPSLDILDKVYQNTSSRSFPFTTSRCPRPKCITPIIFNTPYLVARLGSMLKTDQDSDANALFEDIVDVFGTDQWEKPLLEWAGLFPSQFSRYTWSNKLLHYGIDRLCHRVNEPDWDPVYKKRKRPKMKNASRSWLHWRKRILKHVDPRATPYHGLTIFVNPCTRQRIRTATFGVSPVTAVRGLHTRVLSTTIRRHRRHQLRRDYFHWYRNDWGLYEKQRVLFLIYPLFCKIHSTFRLIPSGASSFSPQFNTSSPFSIVDLLSNALFKLHIIDPNCLFRHGSKSSFGCKVLHCIWSLTCSSYPESSPDFNYSLWRNISHRRWLRSWIRLLVALILHVTLVPLLKLDIHNMFLQAYTRALYRFYQQGIDNRDKDTFIDRRCIPGFFEFRSLRRLLINFEKQRNDTLFHRHLMSTLTT